MRTTALRDGCSLSPPTLHGEDPLRDLDLPSPPPPPAPAHLLPPSDDEPPASIRAPFISDLEQLLLRHPCLHHSLWWRALSSSLCPAEEELLPAPEDPVGSPKRDASTDICGFCRKTAPLRALAMEAVPTAPCPVLYLVQLPPSASGAELLSEGRAAPL